MGETNVNTLWGRIVAEELARGGLETVILTPGSRSTPLTLAVSQHPAIDAISHLDERSAGFFALGYAKRTGRPAPLVCTSGTALSNFHPAVVEADAARVPMILLTADRPPELADSGANQTIDQEKFYGDFVRHYRKLPEPEPADRKIRSLRTALSRSVDIASATAAGPVHLDVPFRKPLAPNTDSGDISEGVPEGSLPTGFEAPDRTATTGGDAQQVATMRGRSRLSESDRQIIAAAIESADSGLIVCGPTDGQGPDSEAILDLATASGFPVFADPLSEVRFAPHVVAGTICAGYDGYLSAIEQTPDVVVRFGASPTSKSLRNYLRGAGAQQFLVDPAGGWRESTFTASNLVVADETGLARDLTSLLSREPGPFTERIAEVESAYWEFVDGKEPLEGAVLGDAVKLAPDPSTIFVSNSMPVRDLDRFGRSRSAALTVLGNRGASGIDGITSTALGAGYGTSEPLVLVTGDLAYYHDMNGLLAVARADVEATIVTINNDGGGIFRLLPIEAHESFEKWFRTPHGLDFEHSAELYDLAYSRTKDREGFRERYTDAIESDGTHVIEVTTNAEENHEDRRRLEAAVVEQLSE